ncbi:FG-GAP repeat domain-containing protein [Aegicerativicinus sediminis]
MVTDSQWSDLDNDGNIELIIAGDWMPTTILSYSGNETFINKTVEFGMDSTDVMWNVIEVSDLNNDGFQDILGGNTGLNFKWKASKERPVKMYLDDFDNNGKLDQIIFYDYFGTFVPFASKDKLIAQIPSLRKNFVDYNSFSEVNSIQNLIATDITQLLDKKLIKELRSMVYLNKGNSFEGRPFSDKAQYSTIEDILVKDETIIFTGNYNGFVTELGESNSNSGGMMKWNNGNLTYYSTLNLPKDFQGRKIVFLEKDTFLAIANNDKSQIINLKH